MTNLTEQEVVREMNFVTSHWKGLNQYGGGHYNAIYNLINGWTVLEEYYRENPEKDRSLVDFVINEAKQALEERISMRRWIENPFLG